MDEYLTVSTDLHSLTQSSSTRNTSSPSSIPTTNPVTDNVLYRHVNSLSSQPTQPTVDMRDLDILSTISTLKQILHPNENNPSASPNFYAIHRIQNTLLIDDIPIQGLETFLNESSSSESSGTFSPCTTTQDVQSLNHHMIANLIPVLPGLVIDNRSTSPQRHHRVEKHTSDSSSELKHDDERLGHLTSSTDALTGSGATQYVYIN
jgi:hypothetical protein